MTPAADLRAEAERLARQLQGLNFKAEASEAAHIGSAGRRRAVTRIRLVLVLVLALVAAACGRRAALGDLSYYPGATVVGSTSFVGEAYGFPRASWEQVELRTEAPYGQVRDFYAKLNIRGWTSAFENESRKCQGRVYTRVLADARRRTFYVITIEERPASHDNGVLLRRGLASDGR